MYLAAASCLHCERGKRPESHQSVLRTLSTWTDDRRILPFLWSCGLNGAMEDAQHNGFGDREIDEAISNLSTPNRRNAHSILFKALKTTRWRRCEAAIQRYKGEKKRQRISPADRRQVESSVRTTSVFDLLWRIRIRSNYGDADAFRASDATEFEAQRVYESYRTITSSGLLVFESILVKRAGRSAVDRALKTQISKARILERTVGERMQFWPR